MIPAGQPGHEHGNNGAPRQPARRSAESEARLVEKRHGSRERSSRTSSSNKTVSIGTCAAHDNPPAGQPNLKNMSVKKKHGSRQPSSRTSSRGKNGQSVKVLQQACASCTQPETRRQTWLSNGVPLFAEAARNGARCRHCKQPS
jgi:uncharacterized protein involved in type VI secretion and phage assembly